MTTTGDQGLMRRRLPLRVFKISAFLLLLALITGILYGGRFTLEALRWDANESSCRGRLGQIAAALQNYHQEYGCYPPLCIRDKDGKPMHSWRALLLQYFDVSDFHRHYDFTEPWNSPGNSRFARAAPQYISDLFRCPNDPGEKHWTSFVAIDYSDEVRDRPLKLAGNDRKSSKIMLVEVHQSGIHWLEPQDLPLDRALAGLVRLGSKKSSVNFVTADGKVGTLSADSLVFRGSEDDLLRQWLLDGGKSRSLEK